MSFLHTLRSLLVPRTSKRDRLLRFILRKLGGNPLVEYILYQLWRFSNEPNHIQLNEQHQLSVQLPINPLISVIIDVHQKEYFSLQNTVRSLFQQSYKKWELIIACHVNSNDRIEKMLGRETLLDGRIKIHTSKFTNNAARINSALSNAQGDFVGVLQDGDVLSPACLFEITKALNTNSESDLIYSDSDHSTYYGAKHYRPFFRPAFSLYYLYATNYMPNFFLVRKTIGDQIGWLNKNLKSAYYYDLILRIVENSRWVTHVPKILYSQFASNKQIATHKRDDEEIFVLHAHFDRLGKSIQIQEGLIPGIRKITYPLNKNPLVSIIIPNQDHYEDLERCINSIQNNSTYSNFEIIIVENHSTQPEVIDFYKKITRDKKVHVIEFNDSPFNYSITNNYAIGHAKGELLLFLNNDTQAINPDWLERLVEYAIMEDIGVVGAKLYYPDGNLQHAGVTLTEKYLGRHHFANYPKNHPGYYFNLIVPHDVSAVTGACLMIRRAVYKEIGGFDPAFRVDFGDIDLCLKARQHGYHVIFTPYAELFHHESKTRGYADQAQKQERLLQETKSFISKWKDYFEEGDSFFNPNLTLKINNFLPSPKFCNSKPRRARGLAK